MKFTIVIHSSPHSSQAAASAWQFCRALLAAEHQIVRLFFYQEGVYNNSQLTVTSQDELNLPREWQRLIEAHGLDAVSCVSSALKRGIVDESEAHRHTLPCGSLIAGAALSGLGQFVEACILSDRVISFGD